jgi:hypothetical protein
MLFSVYNDIDVNKQLTLTTDKSVIYMGASLALNLETEYSFNKNENADVVYETAHTEDQLGIRISISSGSDILTASDLEGIYITYNGSNYFPRSDGSYRIKIADAVSNVLADMVLNTENGNLETGTYTITAQSFGSIDGTYFSSEIASDSKDVQVVSTDYGFSVDLDDKSVLGMFMASMTYICIINGLYLKLTNGSALGGVKCKDNLIFLFVIFVPNNLFLTKEILFSSVIPG